MLDTNRGTVQKWSEIEEDRKITQTEKYHILQTAALNCSVT